VTALAIFAGALFIVQLGALAALAVNRRHTPDIDGEPALPAPSSANPGPRVLAVVPARNEDHNIAACVRALAASQWPLLRIRVVDDNSTDRTSELVRDLARDDARIELVAAGELPTGWLHAGR
jgi:cellulose synthase/poly-beta-1,6-N-acetylglucosamine synthase-like glycosyltransferase